MFSMFYEVARFNPDLSIKEPPIEGESNQGSEISPARQLCNLLKLTGLRHHTKVLTNDLCEGKIFQVN